ncbi:cell division cycle protein 123 homolog [Aethina tumida]|uniref:cell division cycle protein 123 homolog n=1 Tax=Aethina tumida TaxID=116153 RepID=UPI00096AE286|nr:cell division cycle protein 123 homolog [Aethina tumida]
MRETSELRDFSISSWLEKFQHVTIQTILVNIPDHVIETIVNSETDNDLEDVFPPECLDELKNAINTLNNKAFIKNNWHAPMDAKMFSFGNDLKVSNIDDIFLFLQISTILQEDFSNVKGVPFCIALKEWKNIHPAAEFRCIVINNLLLGITPRDWPTYYNHFKEDGHAIIEKISEFYNKNIKSKFGRGSYIFDVVLPYPGSPYLLDFSPLNSKSNLYAFSWKEIKPLLSKEQTEGVPPVFRYLESDIGIMTRADALYKISQCQN